MQSDSFKAGIYAFYNEYSRCYLSRSGNSLVLSKNLYDWQLRAKDDNAFYICCADSDLLLDIDNAFINEGTTVKVWQFTGYDAQVWKLKKNLNGTYSFLSAMDNNFCLGFSGSNAVLQKRNFNNKMQEFRAVDRGALLYSCYKSKNSIIELQLPLDITKVITKVRLQKWADDLERAYFSYYRLTNFIPYKKIIVEAFKPCEYAGYVLDGCNVIHIDRNFIYGDLQKMAARDNDWNFCALHEMGHMFDCHRPWKFEGEMMTDLKLAFVLEENGAAATPAEFDSSYNFRGADVIKAYEILGSDFSDSYNIFGCANRFLRIKNDIGWTPFKQTFHALQENCDKYSGLSKKESFEIFIAMLSFYSGRDIKTYFSKAEWNTIIKRTKQ